MIEIEIHNFQSIRHVELSIDGFAAIAGRTNIGKSAIVRAVQCALTGAVGTDFVRHGSECDRRLRGSKKCKCCSQVRIKTPKLQLFWEKGDAVNRYTVSWPGKKSEVYEGLERGTPEFLLPDFEMVKVGDAKELIQIPDQFEPIFLLNQSGLAVADVLSDVAHVDGINAAMTMAVKDRKEAFATKKVREKDIADLKAALETYHGLDEIDLRSLTSTLNRVEETSKLLDLVEAFIYRATTLKTTIVSLESGLSHEIPVYDDLESKYVSYNQLVRLQTSLEDLEPFVISTETALKQDLPLVEILNDVHRSYDLVSKFMNTLAIKVPVVRQLSNVDGVTIPDTTDLIGSWSRLTEVETYLQRLNGMLELANRWQDSSNVISVPDVDVVAQRYLELRSIQELLDRDNALHGAIQSTKVSVSEAELEERSLSLEIDALGLCPTCQQPINLKHAHVGAL